ncbi:serine hydrolase [Singulisphaera acidiphila]|nr:serine hydrolase [Singulisphaera acidiphila]
MMGTVSFFILGFACSSLAQTPDVSSKDEIESRIDRVISGLLPEGDAPKRFGPKAVLKDRMAHYHTPGVSIAVINRGRIEWARGFGVKEWGKSDPVSEQTIFQAGSISKPVFAMAVMRLVQDGKLDLDEDVNRYLKSWKVPANGLWQPRVTLRQLLSHTAGLTVHGFPGYARTETIPSVVDVLNGRPPANTKRVFVDILPGSRFRYSGGGTTVAQQLVVDVLGRPFPKIMQELVMAPLGMKSSTYEQPLPDDWADAAATGHPSRNRQVEGGWHVYPEMAAAGLWTTPSDLARVGLEVQRALKGESDRVLDSDKAVAMLTPGIDEKIGIGFFLFGKGKTVRFGHSGADEGFVATMTFSKEGGIGAVVMLNSYDGIPLLSEIERAIAREYDWPGYFPDEAPEKPETPASETLDRYVGSYVTKSKLVFTIARGGDGLLLKFSNQPPLELAAESETRFSTTAINAQVTFEKNKEGKVTGLLLEQDGTPTAAERGP